MSACDALVFVEDPGAANFLADLPARLQERDLTVELLACGHATKYMKSRGVNFVDLTVLPASTAQQLIDQYEPHVIVGGTAENSKTLALALFEEGKRLKIPTVGVVDMMVNADRRFRGNSDEPFAYAPEYIVVPDEVAKEAFISLNFAPTNIFVIGYPHFEVVRQKAARLLHSQQTCDPNHVAKIVFVAEPESEMSPELTRRNLNYSLHGRGGSDFRTFIVLEEVIDALTEADLRAHLIVRLHPKNSLSEFNSYQSEVAGFSEGGDPIPFLYDADLVIGMTSMLLQEAAWLGKQTLSVLPEEKERQRLATILSGLTPAVNQRKDLVRFLERFKNGECMSPNPEDFFTLNATEKLTDFVVDLIRGTKP